MLFLKGKKSELRDSADIRKIWLSVHFRMHLLFIVAFVLAEAVLFFVVRASGSLTIPAADYLWRYLALPVCIHAACAAVEGTACRFSSFPETFKVYLVSFGVLASCGVVYALHPALGVLTLVFMVPVILTLIYGSSSLSVLVLGMSAALYAALALYFTGEPADGAAWEGSLGKDELIFFTVLVGYLCVSVLELVSFVHIKDRVIAERNREKSRLLHELKADGLTGLYNRAALNKALERVCGSDDAEKHLLAFMDFDHFKEINDTYGHPVGDMCLQLAAGVLRNAGANAKAFRYGGDEFCLLFSDVSFEEAMEACGRVQHILDKSDFIIPSLHPTFSIGLAACNKSMTAEDLLAAADQALYHAKRNRNCIRTAS